MSSDRKTIKKRFDFETGYLVKSPCRQCLQRINFPGCSHTCHTLDQIQRRLAFGVVTTCSFSDMEAYAIQLDDRQKK